MERSARWTAVAGALTTLALCPATGWSDTFVQATVPDPATAIASGPWREPDGRRLPFTGAVEVETFLREAEVVSTEPIPQGITEPLKLLLQRDGVRAHAIFRRHHDVDRGVRLDDGTRLKFFVDSYKGDVAAYRLSRLLGMHNVPPTVVRRVRRTLGSVQLWVEGSRTQASVLREAGAMPSELLARRGLQIWEMRVFDNLIDNIDRNPGNMLWSETWDLWLVDHTRTFARSTELPSCDRIHRCSRRLYDSLPKLDEESVGRELDGLFGRFEIQALLVRRDLILQRLRRLIDERGEAAVLFDLAAAPPPSANRP